MRVSGINYMLPPRTVIKQEISNQAVLDILKSELIMRMDEKEAEEWVGRMADICKRTGIEPKRLPINEQFPGDLTPEENHEILLSVLDVVV